MKKLFLLFTLAFMALSCEQIQDFIDLKGHSLVFLEGEMKAYFPDKGDTKNYKFKANLAWSAKVSADWIEVKPSSGKAGVNMIQIKVDKNKSDERRTGYVDITLLNNKSYRIELEQLAAGEDLNDVVEPTNSCPSNEIWYTNGSTKESTTPYNTDVFGAYIVSNTFDAEKECWVIKFDGDVTTVGNCAFEGCSSLTSVTIPDSVTTIGDWAFYWCDSLTSITIPDSVTEIGYGVFAECSNLREFNGKYASGDGRCLIIDSTLNSFAPAGLTEYVIPDSVTTIGDYAFYGCSSLTSVTIPDSVTTIGDYAFRDCSSLKSVYCKVTTPPTGGFWMFDNNASGRKIYVPRESVVAYKSAVGWSDYADAIVGYGDESGDVTLSCDKIYYTSTDGNIVVPTGMSFGANIISNTYENGVGVITFDDNIEVIGDWAFDGCETLTSITIPDGVTEIGVDVFWDCSNLTDVSIPNSVICIGSSAFRRCRSLTSITIPDGVTLIENNIVSGCSSLTSVTISENVTSIGDRAFYYCENITSVYCKAIVPPTAVESGMFGDWASFDKNAPGRKIYVPKESVEMYKSAQWWSAYADDIVGYDF